MKRDSLPIADRQTRQKQTVDELIAATSGRSWSHYELLKRRWRLAHPDASPQEYGGAMRRLSHRLGL